MAEKRVRRRLAAILAADVVGYSGLMGADEEGTLAQLKTLRKELLDPKIAEYGGRVVKTMGDGILVEFPSAVDVVQHAVDKSANRSKGAKGPEQWQPTNTAHHCDYAKNWEAIKGRWGLTMTAAEMAALATMKATCPPTP